MSKIVQAQIGFIDNRSYDRCQNIYYITKESIEIYDYNVEFLVDVAGYEDEEAEEFIEECPNAGWFASREDNEATYHSIKKCSGIQDVRKDNYIIYFDFCGDEKTDEIPTRLSKLIKKRVVCCSPGDENIIIIKTLDEVRDIVMKELPGNDDIQNAIENPDMYLWNDDIDSISLYEISEVEEIVYEEEIREIKKLYIKEKLKGISQNE